jgi:DNA polymerase alpha subunit A
MDFNLLYPSIIQEYNIDFTTVDSKVEDEVHVQHALTFFFTRVSLWTGWRREDPRASINRHGTRWFATAYRDACQSSSAGQGANERQISYSREDHPGSNVFSHDPFSLLVFILGIQYNIKQMVLKLAANGMYGCLGFEVLCMTFKGREILTHTRELVRSLWLDVRTLSLGNCALICTH